MRDRHTLDSSAQFLAFPDGIAFAGLGQDDGKLVAPNPADHIAVADIGLQQARHCTDHLVTRGVAMTVIDLLEAIKVKIEQAGLDPEPRAEGNDPIQLALESPPVEDGRERIAISKVLDRPKPVDQAGALDFQAGDLVFQRGQRAPDCRGQLGVRDRDWCLFSGPAPDGLACPVRHRPARPPRVCGRGRMERDDGRGAVCLLHRSCYPCPARPCSPASTPPISWSGMWQPHEAQVRYGASAELLPLTNRLHTGLSGLAGDCFNRPVFRVCRPADTRVSAGEGVWEAGLSEQLGADGAAPLVGVIMGSTSDWDTMREAADVLEALGVAHECKVVSAHRTPDRMVAYARGARDRGLQIIIAGAGGAAHLPGMVAALTPLPVLGVPVRSSMLSGNDSLLSIVQMPKGVPVGTLAIGPAGAANAGLLAASILALHDPALAGRLDAWRAAQTAAVADRPDL